MHIADPERRRWIQEHMEATAPTPDSQRALNLLVEADIFEQVIQKRYLGTKRFSLEGVTALIPFLDEVLNGAAERGAEKVVMAMSHRGRLNVMVNTLGKSASAIFSKFEDADPRSSLGSGDVKYHVGATGTFTTQSARSLDCIWRPTPATWRQLIPLLWVARTPSRCVTAQMDAIVFCRSSSTEMRRLPGRESGRRP